ncbi:putative crotonobetaine/carnitine-CoA ligase [Eggerthella sp. CAG:298]|nr:putative crotonobetaine/carnitine-CoA ligase [Eggerthella sp. CAG:298]
MADIVGNETLRDLWQSVVERKGRRHFLTFQNRVGDVFEYTYAAFDEDVNRIANVFLDLGIEKGDHVALHLHSSPEFLMCLFGLAKIGAVAVPINEQYLADEAEYILENSDAICVVVEPLFYETYQELLARGHYFPKGVVVARAGTESPRSNIDFSSIYTPLGTVEEGQQGIYDFWMMRCEQSAILRDSCELASDDPVQIIYTSGTTSRPKGVVLTHANMVFSGLYGDWEVSLRGSDRVLTSMPACHSNFQLAALMPVITAGASLIIIEKYSATRFMKQIRHYKATVIQCVAMMLRTLLLQPVDPEEKNHCVREVLYFIPITDAEKEEFEQRFNMRIMNTYGSTESIGWAITDPPVGARNWPSVGRAGLGYKARICDMNDNELPPGEVGEIQIKGERGRSVMLEYYNNPEATENTFSVDGWLKTGDQGYQDDNGWFYFVDRKVNMVKRSGENISTTELEEILEQHPAIAEAAVIGVPDPIRDQAIKAFVRFAPGESMTLAEVEQYCKDHMASFKVPTFYEVVEDFPRACSMKIEKKLLS